MAGEPSEVRLGDLVSQGVLAISDGYRVRNEELGPRGIPFVRGGDIGDGWINTKTRDHIRPELAHRVRAKIARPGDVAFIAKGSVGRAGRLRPGQPPVVFAPQVAYWHVNDPDILDPAFIFYLIRSHGFQAALDGVKTHGAMVADYVSISQQHDFRFRIPDIDSQRAVAQILGALDDKIELNRRMNETLNAIARTIFASWFVDLESMPAGSAMTSLGEHVEVVRGRSYSSGELQDSRTALVTLKSFARGGGYRPGGLKPYVGEYKPEQIVRPGEVVVACTDVTQAAEVIGRPALVRADPQFDTLVASLDLAIVRPRSAAMPVAFLYFLLGTDDFAAHTYARTSGTTVLHLDWNAIASYELQLPPAELVGSFAELVEPILDKIVANEAESRTLAAIRDALLPKLISGEIRVRDAPAAVET